jgi:hypothetical protein
MQARVTGLLERQEAGGPLFRFAAAQQAVLREAGRFAQGWLHRRQEDARSAAETAGRLSDGGQESPEAALRAVGDWWAGALERLAEDAEAGAALCGRGMLLWAEAALGTAGPRSGRDDGGEGGPG